MSRVELVATIHTCCWNLCVVFRSSHGSHMGCPWCHPLEVGSRSSGCGKGIFRQDILWGSQMDLLMDSTSPLVGLATSCWELCGSCCAFLPLLTALSCPRMIQPCCFSWYFGSHKTYLKHWEVSIPRSIQQGWEARCSLWFSFLMWEKLWAEGTSLSTERTSLSTELCYLRIEVTKVKWNQLSEILQWIHSWIFGPPEVLEPLN